MKRAAFSSVVATVLLLGTIQLASADSKSMSDSRSDASPDSADIVAAKAGHTKGGDLRHIVRVDGSLDAASPDAQVLLQINLKGSPDCELEFIWPPSGKSKIIRCGVGPGSKKGTIRMTAPDTLKFVFDKRVIGSPKRYGWRVVTRECAGCSDIDSLPDTDGTKQVYIKHKI